MAEVLGTVVGVVSLGLQVCAGINTYLDGVQCRKEDLEHTTRSCKSMKALLKQIESLRNRISAAAGVNTTTIEKAMAAARAELSLLDEFVGEISIGNAFGFSRSAMERIKTQQRRFLYPFRKDHLNRLNDRLEIANGVLCSAMQLAELEISLNQGPALQGLQASLDSLTQGVSNMHLEMNTAVRQLHSDTTTSHLALANIQKTTHETTSLLKTSHKDTISFREDLSEMKTMLAALISSDGRAILPKLVSKPDALSKISDIAGVGSPDDDTDLPTRYHTEQILNSRVYPEFQCTCNARRVSKTRGRRICLAFIQQERVTDNIHAPRCPFACLYVQPNDKWSFSISTKALRRILHAGLKISMSATFGAGGFGLSPSFTYFPIRENSPAVRVLLLLRAAFQQRMWSDEENDHLLRRGIKTLQVTMTARKWSPFDIDSKGTGLLAAIFNGLKSTWQRTPIEIINFFLSLGIPRDRPDDDGILPLNLYLYQAHNEQEYAEAFDLLWTDEMPLLSHGMQLATQKYPNVAEMENYKAAINISAKMKKLYQNHVMQAIIQESKPMLLDIVEKGLIISELSDRDAFGYKILHYLLGWPEGLRVVVEQCGKSVLQLDDQKHILLLECALKWSGKLCMSPNLECCSHECTCAETVKALLEAEKSCALKLRHHEHWVLAMLSASTRARGLVLEDLRRRREELKELGLLHLSAKQIDWMDLRKPKVLDYHTAEVLHALKTVGIIVPPRLETEIKAPQQDGNFFYYPLDYTAYELGGQGTLSSKAASIYHILGASPNTGGASDVRALASSLYSKGFSDIDVPDCTGVTPLTERHVDLHIRKEYLYTQREFIQWNWGTSIESWLIDYGASLDTQVPNHVTGYTATHQVFKWMGFRSGFTKESNPFQLIHSSWESKGGFAQHILDTCRCQCLIGGCNPYNTMWKMLLQRFRAGWMKVPSWHQSDSFDTGENRRDSRYENRQRLMSFILKETSLLEDACELPRPVKCICLRACTFEMLPLRHTCCDEGLRRCDDEETSEIWEEDQTNIGRLLNLMAEFEEKLDKMDCGLAEFYRAYWIERMNEILRHMDEEILTAEELEDVERLGVKLTVETEDAGIRKTKIEDKDSLDYWVRTMDVLAE